MLLPQLEKLAIQDCPPKVGTGYRSNEDLTELRFPADKKSSIKSLGLICCDFDKDEADELAKFTGSLTSLNHARCGPDGDLIADLFLRTNGSLAKDRITATYNPRFFEQEDLGPDEMPINYTFRCDYSDSEAYEEDMEECEAEDDGDDEE